MLDCHRTNDNGWATAEVRYHGFAGLPTGRGQGVESSVFTCLGRKWRLRLDPGGDFSTEEGKIALYLEHMSEDIVALGFGFSIKGLDGRDAPIEQNNGNYGSRVFQSFEPGLHDTWGRSTFAKRSDLLTNLVEGALVVEVRMKHIDSSPPSSPFIPENPLCSMILKSFMNEESADVVFEVGVGDFQDGKTHEGSQTSATKFYAHRFILQQCAPMLADLCASTAGLSSVPITGVKPEIFRHLLYYVYGGEMAEKDIKLHAMEIIDAADRFSVVNLKLEAEVCYVNSTTISADNTMELLLYADSMNCALLKEVVMDFIVDNDIEVLKKASLKDAPGGLLADLLTAVARGKKKWAGEGGQSGDEHSTICISDLRRKLHEKGLDIDGSRETLIAALEENA